MQRNLLDNTLIDFVIVIVIGHTLISHAAELIHGTTGAALEPLTVVGFEPAQISLQLPGELTITPPKAETFGFDEWELRDMLRASMRIPPGQSISLRIVPTAGAMELAAPPDSLGLSQICLEAVARAPRWLRNDLATNFLAMQGDRVEFFRELLAFQILSAEDPVVDEIAFQAAHISPNLLASGQLYFDLFAENAAGIYEADEYLDYVRVIDHGDAGDENFWTTLAYQVKTADSDTIELMLDRELYYWWVVHPRISDEIPIYIDPATGQSCPPPRGVFWRDYFLNHPDDGYPSLREALQDVGVMYANLVNNGTSENGAVGAVNAWINAVMDFTSRQERPIQPVRIYHLHIGRCGEHQDITAAAARAALIPAADICALSNDHVWNEFWAGRWLAWEPVNNYVADSLVYERWDNGNWRAPALFKWRGDGFTETVTSRYAAQTADLIVRVVDALARPVDGVKVSLASDYIGGGIAFATWGFTASDGRVVFKINRERNFYVRVDSPLGSYPGQGQVTRIIAGSQAGQTYNWSTRLNGRMPVLNSIPEVPPEIPEHYKLTINFTPRGESVAGEVFANSQFLADIYTARIGFYIMNSQNYERFRQRRLFNVYQDLEWTAAQQLEIMLPDDGEWYAVFSNANKIVNIEDIEVDIGLSHNSEWSVHREPAVRMPNKYRLESIYPNPFNSSALIKFSLPAASQVKFDILDFNGREMAPILYLPNCAAGRHSFSLQAVDLPTGMYLLRMEAGGYTDAREIVLIK